MECELVEIGGCLVMQTITPPAPLPPPPVKQADGLGYEPEDAPGEA